MILSYSHNSETFIPEIKIYNINYPLITRLIDDFNDLFIIKEFNGFVELQIKKYELLYTNRYDFIKYGKYLGDIYINKSTIIKDVLKNENKFINIFGKIIEKKIYNIDSNYSIIGGNMLLINNIHKEYIINNHIYIVNIVKLSGKLKFNGEVYKK